jgi:hypothetical protein
MVKRLFIGAHGRHRGQSDHVACRGWQVGNGTPANKAVHSDGYTADDRARCLA